MAAPTTTETFPGSEAENGAAHKPYVPDKAQMPEFTWSAVILGSLLGIVFAGSSLYLVLKVGMTVSASIPVAVLAITVFRAFSRAFGLRRATILENNIVQTAGSAGESIAFGVGVTMPALLILGFNMDISRVMVVSILGGILGILAMIPLRRAFIVKLHGKPGEPGKLVYPEGTACAQVLISGEKGGTSGKTVFIGFGLAFAHKFLTEGMNVFISTAKVPLGFINRAAVFAGEMASELLGVGYIIGVRTSSIMMAGAILGYLVFIPLIAFVGDNLTEKPVPPGKKLISEMSPRELRDNYLLFIGAGCVATAGIISMCRTMPMIVRSVRSGLASMRGAGNDNGDVVVRRTENDMSMRVVIFGSLGLVVLLTLFLVTQVGPIAAIAGGCLVVLFGFLFVTVSARLTGEIGSSSNPISGMTVATLTLTCLIFLTLGWTSSMERVLALSIAAVVCVAASNGGTTAQSLKTGFLVGGTPKAMQYAILIGALTSALVIGGTLLAFNASNTVYSKKPENLPNITLTQEEMARLPENEKETYQGETYLVWDTHRDTFAPKEGYEPRPELATVKTGRYLIDPQTGRAAYLKDPTIMGKLDERDDGAAVKREFDAPKTQVMGIIIDGVLSRKLNWGLVLIGALIAATLELCGVSSLAFAVGIYVPIQFSTPIFLGGLIRWGVDRYTASREPEPSAEPGDAEARARAEIEAIRRSETSPGVLLAAGYIAGGSLAGMLIAFFNFSDELPRILSAWQYRTYHVTEAQPVEKAMEEIAEREWFLGPWTTPTQAELRDLNQDELARWVQVPSGTVVRLPKKKTYTAGETTYLGDIAKEELGDPSKALALLKLNKEELVPDVRVAKGTKLRMPDYTTLVVLEENIPVTDASTVGMLTSPMAPSPLLAALALYPNRIREDITLGELAQEKLGSTDEALALWDKNEKELKLPDKSTSGIARLDMPETLPAGATLKIPQKDWPAEIAFALLILFLAGVGTGKLLKARSEPSGPPGEESPERLE
jgi:putative OPT family oligopeptide transporter